MMAKAAPHLCLAFKPALRSVLPEQALGVRVHDAPVQVVAAQARGAAAQLAPPPVPGDGLGVGPAEDDSLFPCRGLSPSEALTSVPPHSDLSCYEAKELVMDSRSRLA